MSNGTDLVVKTITTAERQIKRFGVFTSEEEGALSTKLALLVETLEEYISNCGNSSDFRIIIFVGMRRTARELEARISCRPELASCVVRTITGRGKKTNLTSSPLLDLNPRVLGSGMKAAQQLEVAKQFRQGDANILIATSVAEEGLDVPSCNLVIRFDVMHHVIGFIQSRGRARHEGSSFVLVSSVCVS